MAAELAHISLANFLKNLVMANGLADYRTTPKLCNAVTLNVTRAGG